ncbi:MAG: tRNA pseudouridine(38-40) synthase TruA [Parachlamydiaceae bacterium]|nr:tRNA pseudouridine(38-40) synthase TruA [Parachlamydiaceae bacterium]
MTNDRFNYKLTIAYDGTQYSGWQIQPNAISIQELIQKAIQTILRQEITLIGSGRTDAGVHAMGQIAHFISDKNVDLYRFLGSLNGILPRDIRIMHIEQVPLSFHAQCSAIDKTYHYHIYLDKIHSPFKRFHSWHLHEKCNVDLLKDASQLFVGTRDFTSFANEAHVGCAARNPVRTLQKIDLFDEDGGVCLAFTADGFLYKMVRNIVGTIVEVGIGKRPLHDIPRLFEVRDRKQAGPAAPPHGLFLMNVNYPFLKEDPQEKDNA